MGKIEKTYEVVVVDDLIGFIEAVNVLKSRGWKVAGGMAISARKGRDVFYQALYKE